MGSAGDSSRDWLEHARDLASRGEPYAAADAYLEALERGAPAEVVHLRLGTLYMELAEHTKAATHLEQVLAIQPDHADALCVLGMVMNDLRRYDDAIRYESLALARRPAFPEAHFNLGLAHFEKSDLRAALEHMEESYALRRGEPWMAGSAARLEGETAPPFSGPELGVNEVKLLHDWEQLEYLLSLGHLPAAFGAVAAEYLRLLDELRGTGGHSVTPLDSARFPLVARTYKRPLNIAASPAITGPLVDPRLDGPSIEARYRESQPSVVVVDDLLSPQALRELRRFCRESTIWNNVQTGYLGAYMFDGFCSEPLLRLAAELRERLPGIFRGLPLQMMWGYKYDCTLPGIGVHADAAAVNMNLWLTEDEANLDAGGGGLLVYTKDAPKDWGFAKYNRDSASILQYLDSVGSVPLRIPHRANRAVIFDSDLFHATDTLRFRAGYLNRRINITLLYGLRSS